MNKMYKLLFFAIYFSTWKVIKSMNCNDGIKDAAYITCQHCSLPKLEDSVVNEELNSLIVFRIENCNVTVIKENAFTKFRKDVHSLYFSNNNISKIAPLAFDKFKSLEYFNFRNNNLDDNVPRGVFQDLKITYFDLDSNRISDVKNYVDQITVAKLILSHNKIKVIPPYTFQNTMFEGRNIWPEIQEINLQHNQIEEIYPESFIVKDGSVLRDIYLEDNKLKIIRDNTFSTLPNLMWLMFDVNEIETVEPKSFANLVNLKYLSLAYNKLSYLPPKVFSSLRSLIFLNLTSNQLTTVTGNTFSGIPKLHTLILSNNKITQMKHTTFFTLGNLNILDISDNRLTDLNVHKLFNHLHRLNSFQIEKNFWSCEQLAKINVLIHRFPTKLKVSKPNFSVPNIYGLPCSPIKLAEDDGLTYEGFLKVIATQEFDESKYEKLMEEDLLLLEEETVLEKYFVYVYGIFWLLLLLIIFWMMILVLNFYDSVKFEKIKLLILPKRIFTK